MANVLIAGVILIIVVLAVRSVIKSRKKGSGCGCGCSECHMSATSQCNHNSSESHP